MIFAMLSGVYFQNFGIIGFSMKLFNLNNHSKKSIGEPTNENHLLVAPLLML